MTLKLGSCHSELDFIKIGKEKIRIIFWDTFYWNPFRLAIATSYRRQLGSENATVFGSPLPILDQRYPRLPCVTDRPPTLPNVTSVTQRYRALPSVTERY